MGINFFFTIFDPKSHLNPIGTSNDQKNKKKISMRKNHFLMFLEEKKNFGKTLILELASRKKESKINRLLNFAF